MMIMQQYFGFTPDEVQQLLTQAGLQDQMDIVKTWYNGYQYWRTSDLQSLVDYQITLELSLEWLVHIGSILVIRPSFNNSLFT